MDPNNPYQGPQAALLETPRPGEATVGSARRRPVGHGWLWWKRAWSLVATNWVLWCLAVLVFFAVIFGISLLSLFVPTLFSPVLAAGLFHLAWRRWGDDDFEFGDLFAGFSNRTGALFLAGLMQLLLQIGFTALMAALVWVAFGPEIAAFFSSAFGSALEPMPEISAGLDGAKIALTALLVTALSLPYMALIWFQAPLVYFGGRNGFQALGESLIAVLKNWAPMLWYSVVVLLVMLAVGGALALLFVLASTLLGPGISGALAMVLLSLLTLVLGLFLMAVLTVSVYASFRDIFGADDEPEATPELA
jgi:hypothetical protein